MPKKITVQPKKKTKIPVKTILISIFIIIVIALLFIFKNLFVVAIVNGKPISRLSVIKDLEKQGGKQTLDTLITKTLILQEANRRKLTVNQKEIDSEIQNVEANIIAQGLTLDQALLQAGMNKADLNEEIKLQLILQKLVGSNISVSDKEVTDYIAAQKAQSSQSTDQEIPKDQAVAAIKKTKLQQKVQDLVTALKSKAKITYFIKY